MKKNEPTKELFRGDWQLPNSDLRIAGELVYESEKDGLILTLYGSQYLGGEDPHDWSSGCDRDYEIIQGNVMSETKITLVDCLWRETSSIGKQLFKFKFLIRLALEGVLYGAKADIKVLSILCEYPVVRTWYDGWKSMEKINVTASNQTKEEHIAIDDQLTIVIVDNYESHNLIGSPSYRLDHYKSVQFQYATETSFEVAWMDCFRFARMLEFTTFKKMPFDILFLTVNSEPIFSVRIIYYHSLIKNEYKSSLHQNAMLFSRWKMNTDELNSVVINWFHNKKLYPIYDYFLDSNDWFEGTKAKLSSVMFNNRFLNLLQGLESYHCQLDLKFIADNTAFIRIRQAILDQLSNSEQKKWIHKNVKFPKGWTFVDRLDDLVKRHDKILTQLLGDIKQLYSYSVQAKDLRNTLSHGSHTETDLGAGANRVYFISHLLLCICILESLEISSDTIFNLVRRNIQSGRNIAEILHQNYAE